MIAHQASSEGSLYCELAEPASVRDEPGETRYTATTKETVDNDQESFLLDLLEGS